MILLDYHNVVIEETLKQPIVGLEPAVLDMTVVDFDGVSYRISTPQSKNIIRFSMLMQCFKELIQWGAQEMLQKEYGAYILPQTESGYDFSLEFDLQKLPEDKEERETLVKKVSLIKRNLLAQPFERAFEQQAQYEAEEQTNPTPILMQIHYRDQETIYIQAQYDRVTVIFSTLFKEETDRIFGRVFLQEFVDARRRPAIQKAPQVLYSSKDPPLEIRHLTEPQNENVGYVTFVLFPRHFVEGEVREKTISQIQLFRDYLHYHIKCSKAYMHSRMRARVQAFLKVLNRAKPESPTVEKKTITGKTLVRA
ncbi:Arp2/3 complex, 34 kd subunit p34-Arc-domain-containing protein [Gigaspora rosea]|uniref:Arp2/3 complex 34 kDa subunit n=1 Tax=Gigaspora rosea TaxID=44941 RepID=A0A397W6T9_9GLOM|nr:Arp2/3 complex, 34 kd subunit p34-Arc-domain-containing protein [Gigaspora rosea]